ncbi:MAG: anti-sigma factor family protein [Planctomycetaceae bacterium]
MNCLEVRDALAEHVLGVAGPRVGEVERHLAWCAACRKEERDLERAASILAFALSPAEPDPSLEDRVVAAVRAQAAPPGGAAQAGRRLRRTTAVLLAAALAVAGLGWGAVMAGRAARTQDQAAQDAARSHDALVQLEKVISDAMFSDANTEALLGVLHPAPGLDAGGSALEIVSPSVDDRVLVIVSGLPGRASALPYRVRLTDGRGHGVPIGKIHTLDADGGASIGRLVPRDLRGFAHVQILDAHGRVVLSGALEAQAPVATPSPPPGVAASPAG